MSDRNILDKYTSRFNTASEAREIAADAPDGDDAEDCGSFGYVRGVRDRAIAIELRKKDGHVLAVPYAYLSRMEFDPAGQIRLVCGNETISIKGRNLNAESRPGVRLFTGITRHKVSYIKEANRPESLQAEKNAVVVESIVW